MWPLAALLAGCAMQRAVRGPGTLDMVRSGARFTVGDVRADLSVVGDSRQILAEALGDALKAAAIDCPQDLPWSCYRIDAEASLQAPAASFRGGSNPPVRVAEIAAWLHEPGATHAAPGILVQHTVAVEGNLSTATWMRVSDGLATDLATALAARGRNDIAVRLPAWAAHDEAMARVTNVQAFHVAEVGDSRADRVTIGRVSDGVAGAWPVVLSRPPTDYLTEAIGDELRAAGHVIVPAPDGRFVGTVLDEFWIEAAPASGSRGWQVQASVALDLEVAPPPGVKRRKAAPHSCQRSETLASAPGDVELARVLTDCIGDLMRSIRADAAWSQ